MESVVCQQSNSSAEQMFESAAKQDLSQGMSRSQFQEIMYNLRGAAMVKWGRLQKKLVGHYNDLPQVNIVAYVDLSITSSPGGKKPAQKGKKPT